MSDVTQILARIESGDPAAADQLLPLVYDELRKLAAAKLAQEKPGQTLQATALVHEAYLRLAGQSDGEKERQSDGEKEQVSLPSVAPSLRPSVPAFSSRSHFLATAATAMRQILIDSARRRQTAKRGGELRRQPLEEIAAPESDEELLALDEALKRLAVTEPEKARLVELRYFAGMTGEEAALALGISPSTADRHWAYARAWLQSQVRGG
jgi:RNA polymerase sigma factor (sigma-70 family)